MTSAAAGPEVNRKQCSDRFSSQLVRPFPVKFAGCAGSNDSTEQPLGKGGTRLFDWYFDGDTPIRHYQAAASRGVSVPPFKLSSSSAAVFEELAESSGAVVTGIAGAGCHAPEVPRRQVVPAAAPPARNYRFALRQLRIASA